MAVLKNIPEGYLVVVSPAKSEDTVTKHLAIRQDVLEYRLTKDLVKMVQKKGVLTIGEANRRLHTDRIVDPNGRVFLSAEKIASEHPLEFKIEGKHIMAAR